MDISYPSTSASLFRALWQTDPQNTNGDDADLYVSDLNGIGIEGQYAGSIVADTWQRVVFAVDLAAPSRQRLSKYIDGVKVGTQALDGIDGRLSLQATALLFTTGLRTGVYTQPGCVNSIQFAEGRLSDADIAALGRPGSGGVPLLTILGVERTGDTLTLRWKDSSGVFLQKATSLVNPEWQDVPGTLGGSTYSERITSGNTFYRLTSL